MKRLMLSTAILAASALGAGAADDGMFHTQLMQGEVYASDFIGMKIYTVEKYDASSAQGVQTDWKDIGEVHDVILSQDGNVDAVLVDVGGFLGMGEHTVALNMNAIKFVADDATKDVTSDFFLVVNASKDQLEAQPEFDTSQEAQVVTDQPDAATDTAAAEPAPADGTMAPAAGNDMAQSGGAEAPKPADGSETAAADAEAGVDKGYQPIDMAALSTDDLQGAPVYSASDEEIGEVSELVLDADGKVTQAVVDVGGLLGIGEKPVALDISDLRITKEDGGDEIRIFTQLTKDQLDAMPEYQKS